MMNPILRELINKHLSTATPLPEDFSKFLEELNLLLDAQQSGPIQAADQQTERDQGQLDNWPVEIITTLLKKLAVQEHTKGLYNTLVEELASKFEFSRVQLLVYNPVANNLRVTAVAGSNAAMPLAQAAIVPLNRGIIGKAAETRRNQTAQATEIDYSAYPDLISESTQSEIAIPLFIKQELHGVLDIQSSLPRQFSKEAVLFLDLIAAQTSYFVQNIQFRDEMQDQMDELSILQRMTTTEGWKTFSNLSSMSSSRYVYDQGRQDTVPVEDKASQHPGAALIKPLEIRGQTIGALGINAESGEELTSEEKLLLESISSEVAEALERARLFETSQRSAAELAVLNEMGNSLSQAVNEESILKNIYTYTSQLMDAPQFYVAIYHKEEETISFPYVNMHGVQVTEGHPDAHQWLPRPVGTGLTGYIIKNQVPILLDSQAEEKLAEMGLPFMRFGSETQSWLGVPMIIGRTVLGVISVQSEETPNLYNQHHLDLLTTIAYQAAIAINNTRLLTQQQLRAEQEHLVRTVTDKIRRGTDAANIMQVALEELSTILDADISAIQLGTQDSLLTQNEIKDPNNSSPNGHK